MRIAWLLIRLLGLLVALLLLLIGVAWAIGALWFDFPIPALRRPIAVAFGLGAIIALLWVRPRWRALLGLGGAVAVVAVWELTIPPTNIRDWQLPVVDTSYFHIDGDRVVIHNFRNFDYITKTDFGPEGYVSISVETWMKQGQGYSPIAGLYRQFALYYVIGDERDIVRVRTNYRS